MKSKAERIAEIFDNCRESYVGGIGHTTHTVLCSDCLAKIKAIEEEKGNE